MKILGLIVCSMCVVGGLFGEDFFYDLDSDQGRQSYKNPEVQKPEGRSRGKTCKTYLNFESDSDLEVKPIKKAKAPSKTVSKPKSMSSPDEIKRLLVENSRLLRENIKTSNELKRKIPEIQKAIEDLNRRLDEYEKN